LKKNLLCSTSFYLALFLGTPVKIYACDPESQETISRRCSWVEQTFEENHNLAIGSSMPRNGAQWETLMKEQGALTVSQLKEAAICFYKEGRLSLSATLFSHYLKRVPYGDQPDMYRMAGTALHRADFYMPSAHAWDQYFLLTPSPSAADYLHAGRAYFSANKNEPSQTCFRA
jgi:hypothetical protein